MFGVNIVVWLVVCESSMTLTLAQHAILGDQKSWSEAKLECQREGGSLVLPRSEFENNDILSIIKEHDGRASKNRYWINTDRQTEWVNQDGANLQWTQWKPGAPSVSSDGSETCAVMDRDNGNWHEQRCTNTRDFICEYSPGGNYWYYQDAKNWKDARATCESMNAVLVLPKNSGENGNIISFIQQQPQGQGRLWINTKRPGYVDEQGESLVWSKFKPGLPDDVGHGTSLCAAMDSEFGGDWFEEVCADENFYVCDLPGGNRASDGDVPRLDVMTSAVCGMVVLLSWVL